MAGIRRFVTYIYGYEDGEKGENTGFARIEVRQKECRIEIHFRGITGMYSDGEVSLFQEEQGKLQLHPIGKMQIMNGHGDYGTVIHTEKFGGMASFSQMDGIMIREKGGKLYLTKWTEGKGTAPREENLISGTAQRDMPDRKPIEEEKDAGKQKENTVSEHTEKNPADSEELQATELPMKNIFPQFCWRDSWERMQENHECFHPAEQSNITCIRIELRDLKELPRKYWYLGNNSFLLHGFFNYHYLVLGKFEKDRWFIGIPGVYQQQERVMAAIFGFPEFLTGDKDFQKSPGTEEPVNRFGYWYHTLDE